MALYLKYRPKDFESIVWQDFVKNTLRKAVETDKTVWAYLLCGPRWTWKTSTARILAKAVNCLNPKDGNPCNSCKICNEINTESLVDVIEIDAASNTWVDNIREIISKAHFRPTSTKYKIYIIDEVHMLSKWAFNALLKILEEPPEFVKFILATTETHKVPETIISRCQRYDFKNINDKDIESRLNYIAKKEDIKVEKKAIDYIVKNSAWGLRNAISLFEQMISNNSITYENIVNTLWIIPEEKLEIFLNKLISKDSSITDDFDELISSWKNIKLFFKDLIFFTKNKTIESIKNKESINSNLNILEILNETYSKTKNTLDENTTFLIWILKILNPSIPLSNSLLKEKGQEHNKKEIEVENKIKVEKNTEIKNKDTKIKSEEKIEIKNGIEVDDIWDIFNISSQPSPLQENGQEQINNNSSIFDKKWFFEKLKKSWVKWMIISSLKASDIFLKDNIFTIKFNTKFVLKQFNNSDNINILKTTLEEMWYKNIEIKLS